MRILLNVCMPNFSVSLAIHRIFYMIVSSGSLTVFVFNIFMCFVHILTYVPVKITSSAATGTSGPSGCGACLPSHLTPFACLIELSGWFAIVNTIEE